MMRFSRIDLIAIPDVTRRPFSWADWQRLRATGFIGTVWNDSGGWYSNDPRFMRSIIPKEWKGTLQLATH